MTCACLHCPVGSTGDRCIGSGHWVCTKWQNSAWFVEFLVIGSSPRRFSFFNFLLQILHASTCRYHRICRKGGFILGFDDGQRPQSWSLSWPERRSKKHWMYHYLIWSCIPLGIRNCELPRLSRRWSDSWESRRLGGGCGPILLIREWGAVDL